MILATGSADVTTYFVLRDSTTRAPKADVTITDIDIYYTEQGAAESAKADLTALDAADSAHSDNKGYHIGRGLYRIDWPDAAFDGGAGKRVYLVVVATGIDTCFREVLLSPAVGTAASVTALGAQAKLDVNAEADTAITDAALATAANLALVKAKTDNLPASPAASGSEMILTAAYDAAKTAAQASTALSNATWTSAKATYLDASISSRSTLTAADVWSYANRTLTSFGALVSDIWSAVTDSAGVTTLLGRLTSGWAALLDVAVSTRSTLTSAEANAAADTALSDVGLTTTVTGRIDSAISSRLATSEYTSPAAGNATAAKLDTALELDGAVYRFTANALEQAPSSTGGDATAANQADILTDTAAIRATIGASEGVAERKYTLFENDGTTPVADAKIDIYSSNSDGDKLLYVTSSRTDVYGNIYPKLEAGYYLMCAIKAGYSQAEDLELFTDE